MPTSYPALTSLPRYAHVLLDLNGTFMFDYDRFGPGADFGATYASLGYDALAVGEAQRHVRAAYDYMAARYVDPAFYHDFPTVDAALIATGASVLPKGARQELIEAFERHEIGHVPEAHASAVKRLARHGPISVISNLWSPPALWIRTLAGLGLSAKTSADQTQAFEHLVFSSDGASIKPHPAIFRRALDAVGCRAEDALYIGDSFRCDVMGAHGVGMDALWLHGATPIPSDLPPRTYLASDLVAFVTGLIGARNDD